MSEALDIEALVNESLDADPWADWPDGPILTIPETIRFVTRRVQPSGSVYITRADSLVATINNSQSGVIFNIVGRILMESGVVRYFQREIDPTDNRAGQEVIIPMTEGFLLSAGVIPGTAGSGSGRTFVHLALTRGIGTSAERWLTLTSGYMLPGADVFWPTHPPEGAFEKAGLLRSIVGTNPAVGAEVSETVPTNARWKLLSFAAALDTNSNVANRGVQFLISDGSQTFLTFPTGLTQAASLSRGYNWCSLAGYKDTAFNQSNAVFGLPELILSEGFVISTSTENLQAGDDWRAVVYTVLEWFDL